MKHLIEEFAISGRTGGFRIDHVDNFEIAGVSERFFAAVSVEGAHIEAGADIVEFQFELFPIRDGLQVFDDAVDLVVDTIFVCENIRSVDSRDEFPESGELLPDRFLQLCFP